MTMHPEKRKLRDFILEHLRNLLRNNGGSMDKLTARAVIHETFTKVHGWSEALDEQDGDAKRKRWENAWGHALRTFCRKEVTKPCGDGYSYELTPSGRMGN